MSEISKIIGQRIRSYRLDLHYSQEKLAELAGCHPTYIGQLERGEKNATLESIEKISIALNVPLSELFCNLGGRNQDNDIALKCYNLLLSRPHKEQETIYKFIKDLIDYKTTT